MSQVLYELYQKYGRDEVLQGGFQVLLIRFTSVLFYLGTKVLLFIENRGDDLLFSVEKNEISGVGCLITAYCFQTRITDLNDLFSLRLPFKGSTC